MINPDVELIQRVLDGDDTAFSELVSKYQKSVHALAWRKTQDFHIAEDITQETFLRAYRNLSKLKEPHSFASWLYVITVNYCNTWLGKKSMQSQSLARVSNELEKATYSSYVSSENERTSVEAKREVVKKLLAKLQESDRTVVTLYYLGEMTYEEISRFLGVSVSAIKNRLYRARQLLKKEEPMIREALQNYQITPNLTENIMREIARLKPAAPTGGKPLVPWVVAASSAILIVLLLGLGSQDLLRFQQPYSLDAQAETTIELVDAPIVLNIETKVDVQNQIGRSNPIGKSDNNGQKSNEVLLASAQTEGEDVSVPKRQWIQSGPVKGSDVGGLTATSDGELFTYFYGEIHKFDPNGEGWQQIFNTKTLDADYSRFAPMKKWNRTLYMLLSKHKLFASEDDGKTWEFLYAFPVQHNLILFDFVTTEQAFYIIFSDHSVFRSDDNGKTWNNAINEFPGPPTTVIATHNTIFAGTNSGIYRWNTDRWKYLKFPVSREIEVTSITAIKDQLYVVGTGNTIRGNSRNWWIFRSADLGESWEDITPKNAWSLVGDPPDLKLIAVDKTLLLMERGVVRSEDGGNTWLPLQSPDTTPVMDRFHPAVVMDENTIYVGSPDDGLSRSTDAGKSWEAVNFKPESSLPIDSLIAIRENDKAQNTASGLYGRIAGEIAKTTDKGKSWKTVQLGIPITSIGRSPPSFRQISQYDNMLYAKARGTVDKSQQISLFYISADGSIMPVEDIPSFNSRKLQDLWFKGKKGDLDVSEKSFAEQLKDNFVGADQFFNQIAQGDILSEEKLYQNDLFQTQYRLIDSGLSGAFAVSGNTFYAEYNFRLFRCKRGDTTWYDTGVEETGHLIYMDAAKAFEREGLPQETIDDILRTWSGGFKLAVSGDTVYVGKRDGHLVVSFDTGNNWLNLTPALPFPVRAFKKILFVGPTVYVATDAGVATSKNGKNWHAITDAAGTILIIEKLAVDENVLYGSTKDTGVYRLEDGNWKQVITDIPERVTSLAVDGNTVYVSMWDQDMLYYNLDE